MSGSVSTAAAPASTNTCSLRPRSDAEKAANQYTCVKCINLTVTGFTAWRNHMKRAVKAKRYQEDGAKVWGKRRKSMRPEGGEWQPAGVIRKKPRDGERERERKAKY